MAQSDEFFIHTSDTPKQLFVSRSENIKSTALSPCCMTPEDVDYEMATGKHPEILQITGMNQKSLEHFVSHYGSTYRYLYFFKCQKIQDFSPLEDLTKLEQVDIYWNTGTDKLWNFSRNTALNALELMDCKKITRNPQLLVTSPTLERVRFCVTGDTRCPMEQLDMFGRMPMLRHLVLRNIRVTDTKMDFLKQASKLERFDFDPGMLTTEEIARLVANFPHLAGNSLGPYNTADAILNDVRVCGYRKPGLDLPQHQKRLDRYVNEFNALVEKYRKEP